MADKCQGMFLWIKMQQNHLGCRKTRKQLQDIVNKMPTGLTNTYERNWKEIQKKEEDERNRAVAILRWVIFAVRPLTVLEITDALLTHNSNHNDKELPVDELPVIDDEYINLEIKDICGSLVDIRASDLEDSPASRTIQLIHFSVREFLVSVLPSPYAFYDININMPTESSHHTVLAETCLRYLGYSNVWQALNSGKRERCFRPFVNYSTTSWPTHYRQYHSSLLPIFRKFFDEDNPNFQNWRDHFESIYVLNENDSPNQEATPSTPLYYIALFGLLPDFEFTSQVLYRDLNQHNGRFGSPLSAACSNGHLKTFQRLIQIGADINAEGGQFGSALNTAVTKNQEEMVRTLVALGASQEPRDFLGRSPVYIASKGGSAHFVSLLLQHGGDIITTNNYGYSPLNVAASCGHLEVVRLLLEKKADLTVVNSGGWTPLNSACYNGHLEVVRLLLEKKADLTVVNSEG